MQRLIASCLNDACRHTALIDVSSYPAETPVLRPGVRNAASRKDQTMAKNFIQPGRVVTLVAPTGGVLSGQAVQVGALFGIAALDAIGGADVEVALEGVWELPKAAVAIAQGAPVFWDAATGNVAANIGVSNALIGGATEARGTSDLTIRVRLNGV